MLESLMTMRIYAETRLPTIHGQFRCRCYRDENNHEAVALATPFFDRSKPVNLRIHSSCITSEVFGSMKCDCQRQFKDAMGYLQSESGVLIYLFQEGRGIGLGEKIRAYALQEAGYDTIEANEIINAPIDGRTYDAAFDILKDLQITQVNLLTNNPEKVAAVNKNGFRVVEQVYLRSESNPYNSEYLATKREKCGHAL